MEILRAYGDYLGLALAIGFTAFMVSIPVICQRAAAPHPFGGQRRE